MDGKAFGAQLARDKSSKPDGAKRKPMGHEEHKKHRMAAAQEMMGHLKSGTADGFEAALMAHHALAAEMPGEGGAPAPAAEPPEEGEPPGE